MNASDFYELLTIAARWHVASSGKNLPSDGYTLMHESEVQGWFETLPDPEDQRVGTLALHPWREQARVLIGDGASSSTNQWAPIEFEVPEVKPTDESGMASYAIGQLPARLARRLREIEEACDLEHGSTLQVILEITDDWWTFREVDLEVFIQANWMLEQGATKVAQALATLKEQWRQEDGGKPLTTEEREDYEQAARRVFADSGPLAQGEAEGKRGSVEFASAIEQSPTEVAK